MRGSQFLYGKYNVISVADLVAASMVDDKLQLTLRGEQGSRNYYADEAKTLWKQIKELDTTLEDLYPL